jgi:lipopolysaccharide transport system permease protein
LKKQRPALVDGTYHLRIQPSKTFFEWKDLFELWEFRELLLALAVRDIKLRYRQTALGIAWVVLQPFVGIRHSGFRFRCSGRSHKTWPELGLCICAGRVYWMVPIQRRLFPSEPISVATLNVDLKSVFSADHSSSIRDNFRAGRFGSRAGVFFLVAFLSGIPIGGEVVMTPVWLGLLLIVSFGLGLFSAALSVRFRDVQHISPFLVQILFYASPIAYQTTSVPARWRGLFLLNPLAPLFEGLRWSLLREGQLHLGGTLYALGVSILVFVLGPMFFRNTEREFSDLI